MHKEKRRHFHAKTTSAKLYINIEVGSRNLFIDEAHTELGIFPVSFHCMLPTPLCGIFDYARAGLLKKIQSHFSRHFGDQKVAK